MKDPEKVDAIELAASHNNRLLAADLGVEPEAPPILLATDGTPEGTYLVVKGQLTPFKSVSIYCCNNKESDGEDYSCCDVSVTIDVASEDGMTVTKSLRLRKDNY